MCLGLSTNPLQRPRHLRPYGFLHTWGDGQRSMRQATIWRTPLTLATDNNTVLGILESTWASKLSTIKAEPSSPSWTMESQYLNAMFTSPLQFLSQLEPTIRPFCTGLDCSDSDHTSPYLGANQPLRKPRGESKRIIKSSSEFHKTRCPPRM